MAEEFIGKEKPLILPKRIGPKADTPSRRLAAQFRWLSRRQLNDAMAEKIIKVVKDSEASAVDIRYQIERLGQRRLSNREKANLINILLAWHKICHGEKRFNVNTNTTVGYKDIQDMMFGKKETKNESEVIDIAPTELSTNPAESELKVETAQEEKKDEIQQSGIQTDENRKTLSKDTNPQDS